MSGGYDRNDPEAGVPLFDPRPLAPGESGYTRKMQRLMGAEPPRPDREDRRRALTRPARPGFCWLAVELFGKVVDRPGLVARWVSTPDGWQALVAWTGLDGDVRVEWVAAEALTEVKPERAP